MDDDTRDPVAVEWEPYVSCDRLRVIETSCCGAFEWACQGGQYLVLRERPGGGFEEAGRGRYAVARRVWQDLVVEHHARHETSSV